LIRGSRDDPDLFRVVYDRYAERVHRFFARRTGNTAVALDLTAETFAQAWIGRERFGDHAGGSAGPWLFTIARRLLIASVERGRLERRALQQLRVDFQSSAHELPADPAWLDGLDDDLAAALDELPRDLRRAVELRVLGDLPYTLVAGVLGCSPTAARIRVSRGLKRLRARLEMNQ
jgi:RNA polymerase sigma factor (sigma-70 family)